MPDPLADPIARGGRAALREAGEKLLPGSGVACPDPAEAGPCENGQVEGVLFTDVRVHRHPRLRPYRGPRSGAALARNHPLSRSAHPQRNVDLAAAGATAAAAFEERVGGRWRVLVSRSGNGGRTFGRPIHVGSGGAQWNPAVALSAGRVICAWTELRKGRQRVRVAVSGDGGSSFGPARTLPPASGTAGAHLQWTPELVLAAGGGAHLVYLEEARLSGTTRLRRPMSSTAGWTVGGGPGRRGGSTPPRRSRWRPSSTIPGPRISPPGKRVAIAWVDFHTYDWRPYARLSVDGGRTFGPEREVSDTGPLFGSGKVTEQLADSPSVAIDGGRTFVAWTDWRKEAGTFPASRAITTPCSRRRPVASSAPRRAPTRWVRARPRASGRLSRPGAARRSSPGRTRAPGPATSASRACGRGRLRGARSASTTRCGGRQPIPAGDRPRRTACRRRLGG